MIASEVTLLTTGGSSRHERSNKVMDGSRNQNLESLTLRKKNVLQKTMFYVTYIQTKKTCSIHLVTHGGKTTSLKGLKSLTDVSRL